MDAVLTRTTPMAIPGLVRATDMQDQLAGGVWSLEALAGRLVELSGDGRLTLTATLLIQAQRAREPVVWISAAQAVFFPPDMAAGGVDLEALPVIRVPSALWAARVADRSIRSGAFGVVVVDLDDGMRIGASHQGRLAGLARRHDTALICLLSHDGGGSSMVSLRGHSERRRTGMARFRCELRALKDKCRGPGWRHAEICRGPSGLR